MHTLDKHGFHDDLQSFKELLNSEMQSSSEELKFVELTDLKPVQPNWASLVGLNAHTHTLHPNTPLQPTVTSIPPWSVPKTSTVRKPKSRRPHADVRPKRAKLPLPPASSGLPTSDHIIWEEAGRSPPSSVWVRPHTPTMRGGEAQIIPPNAGEQWNVAVQKLKNHWTNRKDTYTDDMVNGMKSLIVLLEGYLEETTRGGNRGNWFKGSKSFCFCLFCWILMTTECRNDDSETSQCSFTDLFILFT